MTETERLRAAAQRYRDLANSTGEAECDALAALFDGLAERHTPTGLAGHMLMCARCRNRTWPCPDVCAGLAVADALGIEQGATCTPACVCDRATVKACACGYRRPR